MLLPTVTAKAVGIVITTHKTQTRNNGSTPLSCLILRIEKTIRISGMIIPKTIERQKWVMLPMRKYSSENGSVDIKQTRVNIIGTAILPMARRRRALLTELEIVKPPDHMTFCCVFPFRYE